MITSKIQAREKALEIALRSMGNGTPINDIVSRAIAIEVYLIGSANLPETESEPNAIEVLTNILSTIGYEHIPTQNATT